MGQATIFPTLFDLMGLRWAPAVADLDPLRLSNSEFIVRNRKRDLMNRVFDISSSTVDEALRVPEAERRTDLYRTQESIPGVHPNGYFGPGLNLKDSHLQEGYSPTEANPVTPYAPAEGTQAPTTVPNPSRTIIVPQTNPVVPDAAPMYEPFGDGHGATNPRLQSPEAPQSPDGVETPANPGAPASSKRSFSNRLRSMLQRTAN